jgi:toxin HigB-1
MPRPKSSFTTSFPNDGKPSNGRRAASSNNWIAAVRLNDLALPGNHREPPRGDRKGRHSVPINGQYRICFVWREPDALDAEIVDYH